LQAFPYLLLYVSCNIRYTGVDSCYGGRELLKSPDFLSIRTEREVALDPISDVFRTLHVTAFGLHRLEATAPWGVRQENQTEEVASSGRRVPPSDLAHFAMLSRG